MPPQSVTIRMIEGDDPVVVVRASATAFLRSLKRELLPVASETGKIIWTDAGCEVLVRVAALRLSLSEGLILVELPLFSDQTGDTALVVPYQVGSSLADAAIVALTEGVPRGDERLAARWGLVAQEAVWNGILRAGQAYRDDLGFPRGEWQLAGLFAAAQLITFVFTRPISINAIREYLKTRHEGRLPIPDIPTR